MTTDKQSSAIRCEWCQEAIGGPPIMARCLVCGLLLVAARSGIPGAWGRLVERGAL